MAGCFWSIITLNNTAFALTHHGKLYSDLAIKTVPIPKKYFDETSTEKLQN